MIMRNGDSIVIKRCSKFSKQKQNKILFFSNDLIDSENSRLFEATKDTYQGIGLDIKFAHNTHPDFYVGSNILDSILEKIRDDFVSKDL